MLGESTLDARYADTDPPLVTLVDQGVVQTGPVHVGNAMIAVVAVGDATATLAVTVVGEPLHVPVAVNEPVHALFTVHVIPTQVAPVPLTLTPETDPVPVVVVDIVISRVDWAAQAP